MKSSIRLFGLFMILLSVVSTGCKKCQKCNRNSVPEIEVCQDDYIEKSLYTRALEAFEASGYECE